MNSSVLPADRSGVIALQAAQSRAVHFHLVLKEEVEAI